MIVDITDKNCAPLASLLRELGLDEKADLVDSKKKMGQRQECCALRFRSAIT